MNFPLGSKILQVAYGIIAGTKSNEDEVAVFDNAWNQAFPAARPVKVTVSPMSRLMDHPVENGSIITDFRVIMPTQLELSLVCSSEDYRSVYQQIKSAYLSGEVFSIIDKADTYFDMIIQGTPYDLSTEMMDGIMVGVRFREVRLVNTQYQSLPVESVSNANDQSTLNSGMKTPATVPETNMPSSIAKKGYDYIKKEWIPKVFK